MVYPFYSSDDYRVTISGNLLLTIYEIYMDQTIKILDNFFTKEFDEIQSVMMN